MEGSASAAPADISRKSKLPALSESRFARFATILLLYFMQGVPLGLSLIAVPAWLAANGATPVIVCNPVVAASLFALFMAVPNFARGLMSGLSGFAVESVGYGGFCLIAAATMMVGLAFCLLGGVGDERVAARLQSNQNA